MNCENCGEPVLARPCPIYDPQPTRYIDTYTCDECGHQPDSMWTVTDGRVTAFECWFYSRRADLLRRGLPFTEAYRRAMALAQYLKARCLRANG